MKPTPAATLTPSAPTLRVLLVEDSLPVRRRIRNLILESCPVAIVGEAATVAEALALFHAREPDVVVLDLSLPDGDGTIVLREIKRTHPRCVAIVLTSFAGEDSRAFCLNSGADRFFDKTTEFESVPEVLNQIHPAGTRRLEAMPALKFQT